MRLLKEHPEVLERQNNGVKDYQHSGKWVLGVNVTEFVTSDQPHGLQMNPRNETTRDSQGTLQ